MHLTSIFPLEMGVEKVQTAPEEELKIDQIRSDEKQMSTADWRWAAYKGYWDPKSKRWNDALGGLNAYILQRNARLLRRSNRKPRIFSTIPETKRQKFQDESIGATGSSSGQGTGPALCQKSKGINLLCRNVIDSSIYREPQSACVLRLVDFMKRKGWAPPSLMRFWAKGFDPGEIMALYYALPLRLESAIRELIDYTSSLPDLSQRSSEYAESSFEEPKVLIPDEERLAWEADGQHAFIQLDFCPDQQRVRRAFANTRAAELLLGCSREELLARLSEQRLPLPLPPVDAIRAFIYALRRVALSAAEGQTERAFHEEGRSFYRMMTRGERGCAVLVCDSWTKSWDRQGRMLQVQKNSTYSIKSIFKFMRCHCLFSSLAALCSSFVFLSSLCTAKCLSHSLLLRRSTSTLITR